jgi:hypothetical protein
VNGRQAEAEGPSPTLGASPSGHRAMCTAVRVLGVVAALSALTNGIGALLQQDSRADSLLIQAWPRVDAFAPLNGEPALTSVADLKVSGALTVLVALILAWRSVRVQPTRFDALVLIALSVLLLIMGGGFRPPMLALLLGLTVLLAARAGPRPVPRGSTREALGRAWRPLLGLTTAAFLAVFPGVVLLRAVAGTDIPWLPAVLTVLAFTWLTITLVAVLAADGTRDARAFGGR